MAEGQSRYVQLTPGQAPVEDITPGELNQPIEVPQVTYSFLHFLLLALNFVLGLRSVVESTRKNSTHIVVVLLAVGCILSPLVSIHGSF